MTDARETSRAGNPGPPPHLERSEWSGHPNYPRQLLLLGSHENFRRINATLIRRAEQGERIDLLDILYRRWISAMRSHEGYEEHKLYPYLERRWGVSFAEASEGHQALHDVDARVRAACRARDREAAIAAFSEHAEVLDAHLALEEELVIPLLLALEPAEFERYTRLPIQLLLRDLEVAEPDGVGARR